MERHRRWLMTGSLGFLLVVLALGLLGGVLWGTSTPGFCSQCHEMRPELVTWQASDHRQVACVTCHIEPGLTSFAKHKVLALNQVYRHFTGTYKLPIEWPEPQSSTCLRCHEASMERTGRLDLRLAHGAHTKEGVTCLQCHEGVAHGDIAGRRQTADGDFGRWNLDAGRQEMVKEHRVIGQPECLACHTRERLDASCASCHVGPVRPASHQSSGWAPREHGKAALQQVQTCRECHAATLSPVAVSGKDPATGFARSNVFCFTCHQERPATHGSGWRAGHGAAARSDSRGCSVCHDQARPLARDRAASSYCARCHPK